MYVILHITYMHFMFCRILTVCGKIKVNLHIVKFRETLDYVLKSDFDKGNIIGSKK